MRRCNFLGRCLATVLVASYCCAAWFQANIVGPVAKCSKSTVYVVRGKPDVHGTVRIQNVGDRWLQIKAVHQSCSCVKASISKKAIAPSDEALLEISITGENDGSVFVLTNDPNGIEQRISVVMIPDGIVESNPSSLDFGVLDRHSRDEQRCAVNLARLKN